MQSGQSVPRRRGPDPDSCARHPRLQNGYGAPPVLMSAGHLDRIRIVLVGTTHPGNIGAAARAMKTMGLKSLCLVRPKLFPSAEVTALAAGADDVLAGATVCHSLVEAIGDCVLTVATSARSRSIPWPVQDPCDAAVQMLKAADAGPVALVFGRESAGLDNRELELCNSVVQIHADPAFRSLNVAAAVQIMCYEIRRAALDAVPVQSGRRGKTLPATAAEMERFYDHLEQCLQDIGFHDPEKPRRLMRRLRRLFNRAWLDRNEMNLLRGFLAAVQAAARKGGPGGTL